MIVSRFMDFVRTRQLRDSVVDKVMLVNAFRFLLSRYNPKQAEELRSGPVPLSTNNLAQQPKKVPPVASVNPANTISKNAKLQDNNSLMPAKKNLL